ncbi:MAG: lipocalin family protein, partial [Candidatus Geothermincolia bacterium]
SLLADIGAIDASVRVTSDVGVVAERSMYRNNRREGSCSMGATTPANDYFLAEGTTAWGFSTFVLVQNPNETAANVTVTFMTPDGPVAQPPFVLPAACRKTIKVNDIAGVSNTDLSTRVHADAPVVAERAMYWSGGPDGLEACHASIGVPGGSKSFLLPDGQTSGGRETYALVQNPESSAMTVNVTYLPENGGDPVGVKASIPANSRRTFNMADEVKDGRASILVSVDGGVGNVIAERSMYWNARGAGTDSVGSGGLGTRNWPYAPTGDPYYSTDYEMPQSRSPQELAKWLGSEHMEYDLDGWFFFGGLTDAATGEPGTFAIEVQRIRTPKDGVDWEVVPAMVAYNAPSVGKYVSGYTGTLDMPPFVKVNTDPWLVEIYNPLIQPQPTMTMGVASGTMGVPGVVYRLTWDTPDNEGKRFQGSVLVKDRLGTVNQGDGTTSFFAEFFTKAQQGEIARSFDNSPGAYLEATGDPMTGQGDYYNSFPLMDVQSFSMTRDGVPFSSGTAGTMWTDYTVASYDSQAVANLIDYPASWKFFSIMLPDDNAAIMAIRLSSKTGVMQTARLYHVGQGTRKNGSHDPVYVWDEVDIQGLGDFWVSPASGNKYDMQYRLTFGPRDPSVLTMKMVRPDQEIHTPDGRYIYEGLGTITGTLNGHNVSGTAFTELESVK